MGAIDTTLSGFNYSVSGCYPSPCFYLKYNISEIGFCLRLQVEPTHLGPIDRASPYLWTPAPTQDRIYINQAQHKPSARVTINIKKTSHTGGLAPMSMQYFTAIFVKIRVLSE
jgi:hypothetical protein